MQKTSYYQSFAILWPMGGICAGACGRITADIKIPFPTLIIQRQALDISCVKSNLANERSSLSWFPYLHVHMYILVCWCTKCAQACTLDVCSLPLCLWTIDLYTENLNNSKSLYNASLICSFMYKIVWQHRTEDSSLFSIFGLCFPWLPASAHEQKEVKKDLQVYSICEGEEGGGGAQRGWLLLRGVKDWRALVKFCISI